MKCAVIALNYNDYKNTIKYVKAIQEYKCINRIIVIDNGSLDNSYQNLLPLKNDKVQVIKTDKNGGYAYGNNYGIKYLENDLKEQYDYYCISNSDIEISEETFLKCLTYISSDEAKQRKIAMIAPRMKYTTGYARRSYWKIRTYINDIANSTRITQALLYPFYKAGEYSKQDKEKETLEVECLSGSFFIMSSNALGEIDYLDENTFLFYEEDILGYKLREKAYKSICLNKETFLHYESQTIGKIYNLFKKQKMLFESRKYFHKNYTKISNFKLNIFTLLYYIRKVELIFEVFIRKVLQK